VPKTQNTFITISVLWFFTIAFSWWNIPPRIDDGIYLYPSLMTSLGNGPGGFYNDLFEPVFFIFPTFSFINGVFLFIVENVIGINYLNYKLLQFFSVFFFFFSLKKFLTVLFPQEELALKIFIFFASIIGLSQFSIQFFVLRPEVLGLCFFILAFTNLILYIKKNMNLKKFFIFLGLSASIHPNFLLISVFLILFVFLNNACLDDYQY